jgi:hypothetical protein
VLNLVTDGRLSPADVQALKAALERVEGTDTGENQE